MKTYIFPINFGNQKNPDKVYHALHWGEILFKQVIVVFSALPVV